MEFNKENMPKHIAIIMDGNRRWAKEKNLIPQLGHKEGAENLKRIAEAASSFGIKYLTVYAFSTENWKRSKDEVDYLMELFLNHAKSFIRGELSKRVEIRHTPELTFIYDNSIEYGNKIEKIIDSIYKEED